MNCGDVRDLVHAYADDELDVITAREVDDHLVDCAACRGKLGEVRAVKEAVGGQYFRAPLGLREKVLQEIGQKINHSQPPFVPDTRRLSPDEAPKAGVSFWWRILATAAVVVIVAGVVLMNRGGGEDRVVAEVLTAHLRSLQAGHLTDVESTDQHTVKPWFDTRVDFSPPVKRLEDQGYPLVGGRLDYLEDRPVAALVYSRGKHFINVFVWPGESGNGEAQKRGFNLVHWSVGGMTFWAVSDLNGEELEQFVKVFRSGVSPTSVKSQ